MTGKQNLEKSTCGKQNFEKSKCGKQNFEKSMTGKQNFENSIGPYQLNLIALPTFDDYSYIETKLDINAYTLNFLKMLT